MFEQNSLRSGAQRPFSTQTSFPKLLQQQSLFLPSPSLYMINPFISNNDQFLFRKNYQLLNKPEQFTPLSTLPATDNLRSLHNRNPFTSYSPNISLRNSSVTSPQRPTSLSRVTSSNPQTRFGFKGGLLDTADGWKRDIESQQRQKLHIYGAEGLRYNAYMEEKPRLFQDDYYKVQKPRQELDQHHKKEKIRYDIKPPSFQKLPSNDSLTNYYQTPRVQVLTQKPNEREHFQDEVFESPNFHVVDPRKRESNQGSPSSRNSKVNDMFDSDFDDRCKRSMQYNSYYGGGGTMNDEMLESKKGNFLGSRFRDSNDKFKDSGSKYKESGHLHLPRSMSMESQVHHFEVTAPTTLNIQGKIYYRIPL